MVNPNTGINFDIFTNVISTYGDTSITRTPITKTTSNTSGDETLTEGTPETINAYIVRKNAPWFLDKAGLIQGGDALMLCKSNQTIHKDDKITWNTNNYRVQDVLNRDQAGGTVAYIVCNLFLI